MNSNATSNVECLDNQGQATSFESSHDEFINALFDRAFGPYEVKVGGEDE